MPNTVNDTGNDAYYCAVAVPALQAEHDRLSAALSDYETWKPGDPVGACKTN